MSKKIGYKNKTLLLLILPLCILITILSLPTLLSTNNIKKYFIKVLEKSTNSHIKIQNVSFSWINGQKIYQCSIDNNNGVRLGFESITSSMPFWNVLFRKGSIGNTQVSSPWIHINEKVTPTTFSEKDTKESSAQSKPKLAIKKEKKNQTFWTNYRGNIKITNGKVAFSKGNIQSGEMEGITLVFNIPKSLNHSLFSMNGTTKYNGIYGTFNLDSKVQNYDIFKRLSFKQTSINLKKISAEINFNIKNLPTIFIDEIYDFYNLDGYPPSMLLGPLFNATFTGNKDTTHGLISVKIDATNFQGYLSGIINEEKITLDKPFTASFTISPAVKNILEKKVNLILVNTKNPTFLKINPGGFEWSINNLNLNNIKFQHGSLNFGQITCKNTGNTQKLSGIFNIKNYGDTSLWFAPMEFRMDNGKLYIQRTEILYDYLYQICLWGKVNLLKNSIDMNLGLTQQALSSALGIKGLDTDYVLKVPIKGSLGKIYIDTGKATGKIALLLARKNIVPKGGIWGKVFGELGDIVDKPSNIPPPNPPFPWNKKH